MTLFDEIRKTSANKYYRHVGDIIKVEGNTRNGPFSFHEKLTDVQIVHYDLNRQIGTYLYFSDGSKIWTEDIIRFEPYYDYLTPG